MVVRTEVRARVRLTEMILRLELSEETVGVTVHDAVAVTVRVGVVSAINRERAKNK